MTTFRITLAYDGTDFVGWQRQAVGTSVQGLVEEALRALDGREVAVAGAGRTDAGVHALGQVASFTLERRMDPVTLVRATNARLPPEVRVIAAEEAPPSFHARFAARRKTYRYQIWNGEVLSPFLRQYVWHLVGPLDVDGMARAAEFLAGDHDFAAFQTAGGGATSTVRRVYRSEVHCGLRIAECASGAEPAIDSQSAIRNSHSPMGRSHSAMITYDITGDGFLRHMVRAIVGSLVEVGRRRHPPEWMRDVMARRDRTLAGPTVPAHGLFLMSVDYGEALAAEP